MAPAPVRASRAMVDSRLWGDGAGPPASRWLRLQGGRRGRLGAGGRRPSDTTIRISDLRQGCRRDGQRCRRVACRGRVRRIGGWSGRLVASSLGAPFQAEVSTAEITGVTVGPPLAGITGSGITIALRGGEEPRGHVPVGGESAEDLAAQLRALMGGWSGRAAACGIRVTSPPPPKRTPPWRPWLLMMATFPSVAIANVPQDGVAVYGGAWMAVLYTVL